MKYMWTALVLLTVVSSIVDCRSLVKRQVHLDASIDPSLQEVDFDDSSRDKRKIEPVVSAGLGVKNAVLGLVFNGPKQVPKRATTIKPTTTTEDIVIFEKDQPVSLEVPGQLIGSGFTLITNLSKTVGDLMINSSLRLHRFLQLIQPFLGKVLGSENLVIEAVTEKPFFSKNRFGR